MIPPLSSCLALRTKTWPMRYTEAPNPLTMKLDEADIPEQIAVLARTDVEIFGSEAWGKGLLDPDCLIKIDAIQKEVQHVLDHPQGKVILAGAGTSGRIACYLARRLDQREERKGKVFGLMAGGLPAFFAARESVEDLPTSGMDDIRPYLDHDESGEPGPFYYIGITCGLSAAYVAGQVAVCMARPEGRIAVVGFNPIQEANSKHLEALGCSFKQILIELELSGQGWVLNPVLGPEPITGSTRMKGGTASIILLRILLENLPAKETLNELKSLQPEWHRDTDDLVDCIGRCAKSLQAGAGMVYLASANHGFAAFLDASECPPTFSAEESQVITFVEDAYRHWFPEFDLNGKLFSEFRWSQKNCHVLVGSFPDGVELNLEGEVCRLSFHSRPLLQNQKTLNLCSDLAMKWKLNALSCCAFMAIGKVAGNRMVDLKISNLKLWERASRIVSEVGGVSLDHARALLKTEIQKFSVQPLHEMNDWIRTASQHTGIVSRTARTAGKESAKPKSA